MKYILIVLITALIYSQYTHAKQFEVVAEHSKISFDIEYMSMTKVDGQFKKYRGFFDINDADNQLSNVKVEIVGASVDTNDKKRDFHIRGHEFFFVSKYPDITFQAKGPVSIAEGQSFKLTGDLTLRGVTRPMTFDGVYKGKRLDPWNKYNYFFTLTGMIKRKDFDIVWNKQMDSGGWLVGDEVRLNITVQGQAIGSKTSFSTHMVPQTKAIQERADLKSGKINKLTTPTDVNDQKAPK